MEFMTTLYIVAYIVNPIANVEIFCIYHRVVAYISLYSLTSRQIFKNNVYLYYCIYLRPKYIY